MTASIAAASPAVLSAPAGRDAWLYSIGACVGRGSVVGLGVGSVVGAGDGDGGPVFGPGRFSCTAMEILLVLNAKPWTFCKVPSCALNTYIAASAPS